MMLNHSLLLIRRVSLLLLAVALPSDCQKSTYNSQDGRDNDGDLASSESLAAIGRVRTRASSLTGVCGACAGGR